MARHTFTNGSVAAAASLTGPLTITESEARGMTLNTRSAVTTFPVPCLRPTKVNTVLAFDLMPNGTPSENAGNGYAWFDVCDADIRDSNAAVGCARVAMQSTGPYFGGQVYNGAAAKPVNFGINGASVFQIDTSGNVKPTANNTRSLGTAGNLWTAVYATNGAIQTSDGRLKEQIRNLDLGLDFIMKLRPVSYRWKEPSEEDGGRLHYGFIAQEVQELIPSDAAMITGDDMLSMAPHELIGPLVKAVQELTDRLAALDSYIE